MSGTAALAALSQNSSGVQRRRRAAAQTAFASLRLKSPSGKRRMHSSDQASNILREASAQATYVRLACVGYAGGARSQSLREGPGDLRGRRRVTYSHQMTDFRAGRTFASSCAENWASRASPTSRATRTGRGASRSAVRE